MDNKEQLIEAVNYKFPQNNLIEIYYNIGRALPFTAQRFPNGRVSQWYKNQYVKVEKIIPGGKYGKYGKAFGYYYRSGERADVWENDPKNSWCRKDDLEPQEIPNSGCVSWILIDIQGEPTDNSMQLLGIDDIITFGKYKGNTIKEVISKDWQYIKWAVLDSQRLLANIDEIREYHNSIKKELQPEDIITFGKYKGQTLKDIYEKDVQYLKWLSDNNPDFCIDWENFSDSK